MSLHHETAKPAERALDHVRRELVAISAGLAEHGPTDPRMASRWARDEINKVIAYIRAVETIDQPTTPG